MAPLSKAELALAPGEITESQPQEDPTATPMGTLSLGPPEIRLEIYRNLITAGSVRFLETSKAVYNEAIDVLLEEGICKLEFNICKCSNIYPETDSMKTIPNLVIRFNDISRGLPGNTGTFNNDMNSWLTSLNDRPLAPVNPQLRKSCKILLDYHSNFEGRILKSFFHEIRLILSFETIVLAIASDYTLETKRQLRERMFNPHPDPRRDISSAMHSKENKDTLRAYQTARVALEPTLGPAEWVCDEKGAHLVFHPQAFRKHRRRSG